MDEDKNKPTETSGQSADNAVETPQVSPASPKKQKMAFMKKPAFLATVAAVLVLVGGVAFFALSGDSDEVADTQPVEAVEQVRVTTLGATIATTEGTVEYSNDGATWVVASGGESLAHLDYVRTLDDSRAIVLFDDGSVARLDNNTELYLSSLQVDGLEITLMDGQVYSRVVESENQSFTVVTANDRFKALGTAYKTSTDGEKDELEVYQSDVKVESEDLDVTEGNKYDTDSKELAALDLDKLSEDEFAQWNKEKDSESDEFKDKLGVLKDREEEEVPAPVSSPGAPNGIVLSATEVSDGVKLSWTMNGASSSQGFKIVRDKSDSTPTYGENSAIYVGSPEARSSTWYSDNGGSHYYRVCIYFEGTCSTYSNAVKATSPVVEKDPVVSGDISLSIDGNKLSWSLVGGTAPHGYKVVLSESTGPVYPSDSIQYIGAGTSNATLPDKAAGTYYVRICKYTNGTQDAGCVDYSNEVEYVVADS